MARPLEHTFFVLFRRKMQAYGVKERIDDPSIASCPDMPYRAENKGVR